MRILVDNAILVRASGIKGGLARDLLLRIVESEHLLVLSNEMLSELARVLRYPKMLALQGLSEERVYDYIGFLREVAEIVALNPLFVAPVRDVNDIMVIQTAIVGEAVDLSPKLRQRVKSGISAKREFYLCRCLEEGSPKS